MNFLFGEILREKGHGDIRDVNLIIQIGLQPFMRIRHYRPLNPADISHIEAGVIRGPLYNTAALWVILDQVKRSICDDPPGIAPILSVALDGEAR